MRSGLPDKVADRVVIDGSAAVNAAVVEAAFAGWDPIRLYAPTLLWSEATAGISQMRWRGEITDEQSVAAINRLLAAPIELIPSKELVIEAAALAKQLGWAKTYDAEYVVLAKRLEAPLLTVDARLAAGIRHQVDVVSPMDLERWLTPSEQDPGG